MDPALHLLSDGRLFYSGANVFGRGQTMPGIWDVNTNTYTPVPGLTDLDRRDQASSVLLPPAQSQKVMVAGGGYQDKAVDAIASTAIVDLTQPNPNFVAGPPLETAKMYVNAVILPDSTVLATGGASTTVKNGHHPVFSTQIYNPATNAWTKVEAHTVPRVYHSSALLLPDARVATFGGNPEDSFEMRIEIFEPPYLQANTPRPRITGKPTEIGYGGQYDSHHAEHAAAVRRAHPAGVRHALHRQQPATGEPAVHPDADGVVRIGAGVTEPRSAGVVHALRGGRVGRPLSCELGPSDLTRGPAPKGSRE
jgi:hypothetical protein